MHRLVTTCIKILRGLPLTGLSVNKIIAQTSTDRSHVIEAVNELVRGKLVAHGKWSPGKPKVIQLTGVGTEIKDFLENLNNYTESYKKLNDANTQMKNKNRNLQDGIRFLDHICQKDILLSLAYRYATIYYKNELNETSKAILIKIVSDAIVYHLSHHLSDVMHNRTKKMIRAIALSSIFGTLVDSITYDIFRLYTMDFHISSCEPVGQRVRDLMTTILRITKISQFDLIDSINFVEAHNTNETYWEKFGQDYGEYMYDLSKKTDHFQYGPYDETPNSKKFREKDRAELISIYKNLI